MANKLNILTLNVQGLRDDKKRKTMLRLFKKEKIHVIALQETYITKEKFKTLGKEWVWVIHFAEGTKRSKGHITLFDKSLEADKVQQVYHSDRIIISSLDHEEGTFHIVNVYSPNKDQEKMQFMNQLENTIKEKVRKDGLINLICMGDFNTVMDNEMDIITGNTHPRDTVDKLNNLTNQLQLTYVWRVNNPK
ncbi:Pol-like protein [Elysia marginata]|uniref:exodeoxyribonuclease III n=1 Tax=Elysia marginata TaxID=1093978 RepID=A0AAV4G446_9GAST|nr:Pol-like protein [Elysia marginata]